jgi:hypothetical protein
MKHIMTTATFPLIMLSLVTSFLTGCAPAMHGGYQTGEMGPGHAKMTKEVVYPLAEINLDKVMKENRGLRVLKENATTVRDFYRGGVQEKEWGEKMLKERNWEEARAHFEKSNWFLETVLDYLPEDEAQRNIYGDHSIIFLPNLLIADNQLKLLKINDAVNGPQDDTYWIVRRGRQFLSRSLRSVKTEWAIQIQKEFEKALSRK